MQKKVTDAEEWEYVGPVDVLEDIGVKAAQTTVQSHVEHVDQLPPISALRTGDQSTAYSDKLVAISSSLKPSSANLLVEEQPAILGDAAEGVQSSAGSQGTTFHAPVVRLQVCGGQATTVKTTLQVVEVDGSSWAEVDSIRAAPPANSLLPADQWLLLQQPGQKDASDAMGTRDGAAKKAPDTSSAAANHCTEGWYIAPNSQLRFYLAVAVYGAKDAASKVLQSLDKPDGSDDGVPVDAGSAIRSLPTANVDVKLSYVGDLEAAAADTNPLRMVVLTSTQMARGVETPALSSSLITVCIKEEGVSITGQQLHLPVVPGNIAVVVEERSMTQEGSSVGEQLAQLLEVAVRQAVPHLRGGLATNVQLPVILPDSPQPPHKSKETESPPPAKERAIREEAAVSKTSAGQGAPLLARCFKFLRAKVKDLFDRLCDNSPTENPQKALYWGLISLECLLVTHFVGGVLSQFPALRSTLLPPSAPRGLPKADPALPEACEPNSLVTVSAARPTGLFSRCSCYTCRKHRRA